MLKAICARFDVANPVSFPPLGFDGLSVDKQIE
jgi:hypothetical protein